MPRYIEVVSAVTETTEKILALRAGARQTARTVTVTTDGGKTASVNWSQDRMVVVLNMPSLPPDAMLTRAEADRLVAFIAHECCHVLHSDRGAWDRACQAGARVRDWTNALEDVRIERAEIKAGAFPALQGLLASMANHLHYEAVVEARAHGVAIGGDLAHAPYVACILGRLANSYAIPAAADLANGVSAEVRRLLDVALREIRHCRSTDAVRVLAERLVAMEQDMRPQQPDQPQGDQPQPQEGESQDGSEGQGEGQDGSEGQGEGQDGSEGQGEGQDGSEGQGEGQDGSEGQGEGQDGSEGQGEGQDGSEGQGEGQDGSEGQGEGQDGSEGQGEGQDGSEGQGEGQSSNSTSGEGHGDGSPIASDASLSKTIDKIAERAGIADLDEHAVTDGCSHALSTVRSTISDPLRGLAVDTGMNAIAARDLQARLPRNAVLHGQIGRLLVSDEVRRVTHHETSGRLDRRALARMRCGATDVFSRKDDQPGIDTALMVLIDGSSSMASRGNATVTDTYRSYHQRPSRMAIAQTAAWHIARAAEAANAKVCVAVFHSKPNATGAKITVLKPWETQMQDRAAVLGDCEIDGTTPMSPAIIECSGMLAGVNATRHILMVLTDGECDYGPAGVTRACVLAGDVGVEVVGVGISCASVIAAFPPRYSVNVENLDQLAQAGLGVLVSMLEDANPRGAD